ncbi:MAG: M13 family metallopeptidase [Bdellovibrio sp.]
MTKIAQKLITAAALFFSLNSYGQGSKVVDTTIIDPTVSPCENFFQYSCGKWLKKTPIPGDRPSLYRFSEIDINTEVILKNILEKYKKEDYVPAQRDAKKMGEFYKSCMNTKAADLSSKKALNKLLEQIDNLKKISQEQRPQALALLTAKFHKQGIPVFFNISVDQDPGDAQQVIPKMDQGGMGLPEKNYYFGTDKDTVETRSKYLSHVAQMLKISGIADSSEVAKSVFSFELNLAMDSATPVEYRNPTAIYNKMTLAQLEALAPHFKWSAYFSELGINSSVPVNILVPKYFKSFTQLLQNSTLKDVTDYLKWYTIHSVAEYSFQALITENFNFYRKYLNGQQSQRPRWKVCISSVDSHLGEALGESFVKVAFGIKAKELASSMMDQIQAIVRGMFSELDWMDQYTVNGAVTKLDTLIKKIGSPKFSRNYDALVVNNSSWFENVSAANRFEAERLIAKIGKPVDRTEWGMTASTDNAYYNASINEIVFPAGILQKPLFSVNADLAANYGATGATIGHEITHGFDDEGRKYDENGNLKDWWSPNSTERFNEKAQCLVKQYNQYTAAEGSHVNGELTLGENIADLGGLKIALRAYQKASPKPPQPKDYQRFFVAYAQSWCGKSTPEFEKNIVQVDPHSPARYRVNGVVVNLPEFSEAFSCQQGQPMNPKNRCEIW